MFQPGLFDQQEILSRRDKRGDVLARLNGAVEWKVFEPIIKKAIFKDRHSQAGRKSYAPLLMFKVLILQSLYNMILPVISGHRVKHVEVLQTPWG